MSHDRDLAFGVADRIAVIHEGNISRSARPDEVKDKPDPLIQKFLNADIQTHKRKMNFMKNSLETRLGMFVALAVVAAVIDPRNDRRA